MKKIILVDTSDVGAAYTAEAVSALGFEPIFLINCADFQGDTIRQVKRYLHYSVDTKSLDAMLNVIKENNITEIEGIFTTLDSRIFIALGLAKQLGVRSLSPELIKVLDKSDVAHLIPEFSPKWLSFSSSSISVHALSHFIEKVGDSFLKPTNAAGGVGAKHFPCNIDTNDILRHIHSFSHPNWLLMENINGHLVSLEGFVFNKEIVFLGFTSRKKIGNTESYMEFPFDCAIPDFIQHKTKKTLLALIERSGYAHGYFHSEFIITENDAYLIDANFGRFGGGPLVEVVAYSFGISPVEILKHILCVSLFPDKSFSSPYVFNDLKESVGINYGIQKSARLKKINMGSNNKISHTILLDEDTLVPAMGVNNWSWIGLVSGLRSDALEAMDNLEIVSDAGVILPCY